MISQKFMMEGHAPEHMNMRSECGAAIYSHRQMRMASRSAPMHKIWPAEPPGSASVTATQRNGLLITARVRREALLIRVEVRDLLPLTLSQQGGEAGGSLIREAPGRVGAAPTKPGRASTARWRGSGECGGEEYARNQRYYVS